MKKLFAAIGCLVLFGSASFGLAYAATHCDSRGMESWYGVASAFLGAIALASALIAAMEVD